MSRLCPVILPFLTPRIRGVERISQVLDSCFGAACTVKDRPIRLTYMSLRQFIGKSMLSDCKEYWEYHCATPSCFADLRTYVEKLAVEDQKDFLNFISSRTTRISDSPAIDQVG